MPRAYNPERISMVLADAQIRGDEAAAKLHDVSIRTVVRYRKQLETDQDLARHVAKRMGVLDEDWGEAAREFLREAIAKLKEMVKTAPADQIRDVTGAVKIVGELQIVREAIHGQQPGADPTHRALASAAGGVEASAEIH